MPAAAAGPPAPAAPDARERRAIRDKEKRRQRQRASFADAAGFAYFMRWQLDMRITVVWDTCIRGDRHHGHVLGQPDKDRGERLRDALRKRLRKQEKPFACIWTRDVGGHYGPHIHLALHWPLPLEELAWLLADLTGSLPSSGELGRGVIAKSEGRGWLIKCNTAREEIPSALRWTGYLLDQEPRHLVKPEIDGKRLGVSRDIDAKAVAPRREELEAWKRQSGWCVDDVLATL